MLALIDGDPLLYICGFATQKNQHRVTVGKRSLIFTDLKVARGFAEKHNGKLEKAVDLKVEPLAHALQICKRYIEKCKRALRTDEYKVYLTGKGNFREELATIVPLQGR